MIKAIHEIELIDLHMMETEGKIGQFKKWFNLLPAFVFKKRLLKTVNEFYTKINNGNNSELNEAMKVDEMEYYYDLQNEVLTLKAIECLFYIVLNNNSILTRLKNMIRSRKLRKINDKSKELQYAIAEANRMTGMDIKTMADIDAFKGHVQNRADRLISITGQMNNDQPNSTKKSFIIDYAIRVMNYIDEHGHDINRLKANSFLSYHQLAFEKMEAMSKHKTIE